MTPLEKATVQQLQYMIQMVDDRRNDIVAGRSWEKIIDWLEGRTETCWGHDSLEYLIFWLETDIT